MVYAIVLCDVMVSSSLSDYLNDYENTRCRLDPEYVTLLASIRHCLHLQFMFAPVAVIVDLIGLGAVFRYVHLWNVLDR
jgi:hypothetical protein